MPNFPLPAQGADIRTFSAQVVAYLRHLLATLDGPLVPLRGSGSPQGSIGAPPGTLYLNTAGGDGTTLYVKEFSGVWGWAPISALPVGSVLTNGDFENDFTGWIQVNGAITTTGSEVHGGSKAAKVTRVAGVDGVVLRDQAVTAGLTYRFQFWTRGDGTNAGRYALFNQTAGTPLIAFTSTGVTGATYEQIKAVDVVIPVGCALVRLYCYSPGVDGGYACYDDVEFGIPGAAVLG